MKICYWGTYDRAYPRNLTVIAGLRENGAVVTECHAALWKSSGDKLAKSDGVLCPPSGMDPGMHAPAPNSGSMQVIPPPGSPGGDPTVRPK